MLYHLLNSQRHIREGAACVTALNAWWTGKGRAMPPSFIPITILTTDPQSLHNDGNGIALRLEVRETAPGVYRIGVFGNGSSDTKYSSILEIVTPIPADALIVVDKGMPGQVTPGPLASGWHAFTVQAAGWATGATTYKVA
jgi:hypothetical protein